MRTSTTRRWVKVTVPLVALALVAAACGGDDDAADTTTGEGTTPEGTTASQGTTPATDAPEGTTAATEPPATEPPGTEPTVPSEILTDFGVTDDTSGSDSTLTGGPFRTLVTQIVDGQKATGNRHENGGIAAVISSSRQDNEYDVRRPSNYEEMAAEADDGS